MDRRLLDILVCPICKGKLAYERGGTGADGAPIDGELICRPDRLAYPVRDGIPVMLVDEARRIEQALTPFVALIPARLASTRLPDKPLADIGGSPMVVLVARRAREAGAERVVVATDSERIAQAVRHAGFEAVMTAADHPSGTDRLAEAARQLGLREDEIVVNVQGDEPLIDPALVGAVAARLAASPDCQMATAAHLIHDAADWTNPNVVKLVLDRSQRALLFSRSPIPFARDGDASALPSGALRHIGLYAYRTGFLLRYPELERAPIEQLESLEQLRALWHGHRIVVELAESAPAPGVDTQADLERVRRLLQAPPGA